MISRRLPQPNPYILRDYQRASIDAIYSHFEKHNDNPLVVIPTGGGKAPVLCTFIREAIEAWPDTRILQLVHVKELVKQNHETMLEVMPHVNASVCSASLKQRDIDGQVIFASIQSIYKKGFDLGKIDLVIVDESHLIPHKSEGMYRRLLADLILANPYMKVIGFTATPFRESSGRLDEGEGRIFGRVAYEVGLAELINREFLSPLIHKGMHTKIDVSGVKTRSGEFVRSELSAATDKEAITESAVDEIIEYGANRKSWLAFGVSVDHAEHIRDAIRRRGYTAEMVSGKTPDAERDDIIERFRAGKIRCLTNCDVLTTGFNVPQVDLLAVIRPTKSAGLWVQICGRGTRLEPSKKDCIVLDFGENSLRHGPVDQIKGKAKQSTLEGGDAPVKECPECHSLLLIAARECPDCGHVFPEPAPKIYGEASDAPILSAQIKPRRYSVSSVTYRRHRKAGKPDSVRVDYRCGLKVYKEYLCLDHAGFAARKALEKLSAAGLPPMTVDEALQALPDTPPPVAIQVMEVGKYPEIRSVEYAE